jgi:hypothetical protein
MRRFRIVFVDGSELEVIAKDRNSILNKDFGKVIWQTYLLGWTF